MFAENVFNKRLPLLDLLSESLQKTMWFWITPNIFTRCKNVFAVKMSEYWSGPVYFHGKSEMLRWISFACAQLTRKVVTRIRKWFVKANELYAYMWLHTTTLLETLLVEIPCTLLEQRFSNSHIRHLKRFSGPHLLIGKLWQPLLINRNEESSFQIWIF